jgi:hypothetical protein
MKSNLTNAAASRRFQCLAMLTAVSVLAGCGSMPQPKGNASQPEALVLLAQAQQAHGKAAFAGLKDISVSYTGTWFTAITKIQPEITDIAFRQTSQERMLMTEGLIAQIHSGPGGQKTVIEDNTVLVDRKSIKGSENPTQYNGELAIWYNQQPHTGAAQMAASHIVLHAYQLFLYPAFYVQRASLLELAGSDVINGRPCDKLLAVLRPGIGNSPEDRVQLCIDRADKLVRSTWLTLEGSEPSKGAVVSVVYDKFVEVGGVVWPAHFYETVVSPLAGLPAHDFSLSGLDVNRGLTRADFADGKFLNKAAEPAASNLTTFIDQQRQ